MRRILMVLALVAILVVAMAAPAFAKFHFISPSQSECNSGVGNGWEPFFISPIDCDSPGKIKDG